LPITSVGIDAPTRARPTAALSIHSPLRSAAVTPSSTPLVNQRTAPPAASQKVGQKASVIEPQTWTPVWMERSKHGQSHCSFVPSLPSCLPLGLTRPLM
jgi:hypothetical protein